MRNAIREGLGGDVFVTVKATERKNKMADSILADL